MLQKTDPQPGPFGRPLNQAGDIGRHKRAMGIDLDDPKAWNQSRERIVGHLGCGRRNGSNQGGFSSIGEPQQANIGEHFELELELARLAFSTRRALARRPIDTGLITRVAQPMKAALSNQ